jgi:BstXI restriction endonuclease
MFLNYYNSMSKSKKIPSLPKLLKSKIYKTGQTRGADDDVIFQNRVNRNSTVLIPYRYFDTCKNAPNNEGVFENGFIVLINPEDYFQTKDFDKTIASRGIVLGVNALLFYYSRWQWNTFNPNDKGLKPAIARTGNLGGEYVARVPSTTSDDDEKIQQGFTSTSLKGAGIRVYEYANNEMIKLCQIQLEYLFWKCYDSEDILQKQGMSFEDIKIRQLHIEEEATRLNLNDEKRLITSRILNPHNKAICPLCLEEISASGFFSKVQQAEGREVLDLTVTQLNLFHIQELRIGQFNHRIYNLGWGHHHCNIVVKDSGIEDTLVWMDKVIKKNKEYGFDFNETK